MLRIRTLEIDAHIEEKIEQAHGVAFLEADEVAASPAHYVRRGRNDLYLVYGQTDAGRYLLVVLADHGAGLWRVVTARDMTAAERRVYREERGLR